MTRQRGSLKPESVNGGFGMAIGLVWSRSPNLAGGLVLRDGQLVRVTSPTAIGPTHHRIVASHAGQRRLCAGLTEAASAVVATISLLTRWTVPLPQPTSAASSRMPVPAIRCVLMAVLDLGRHLRAAGFLALPRGRAPGQRALCCGASISLARRTRTPSGSWLPIGVDELMPSLSQYKRMPAASSSARAFATCRTLRPSLSHGIGCHAGVFDDGMIAQ